MPKQKPHILLLSDVYKRQELADPYSYDTFSHLHVGEFTLVQKQFTTHRAVFLHAAWLVQTCVH